MYRVAVYLSYSMHPLFTFVLIWCFVIDPHSCMLFYLLVVSSVILVYVFWFWRFFVFPFGDAFLTLLFPWMIFRGRLAPPCPFCVSPLPLLVGPG
jgi:hypothetical protein